MTAHTSGLPDPDLVLQLLEDRYARIMVDPRETFVNAVFQPPQAALQPALLRFVVALIGQDTSLSLFRIH